MTDYLTLKRDLAQLLMEFYSVDIEPDSDSFDLKGWHIQDQSKFQCPKCQNTAVLFVCSGTDSPFEGTCLFCPKESILLWSDSLSVTLRNQMFEDFRIVFDSVDEANSWPVEEEVKKQNLKLTQKSAKSTNSIDESTDAFAPKGFRHVGWLREEEAKAILEAYEQRKSQDIFNSQGQKKGEARYFADETPEAIKYKSNVHLVRLRKSGERWVGWIRLEEAQAILQALASKSNVTFGHKDFGKGGEVQYYPEESEMAKRFLSQTRLLRRS